MDNATAVSAASATMVVMSTFDVARPRRRAPWADARFLLGILLIVASIAGVWFVVTSSRTTAPVYAATHTIVPGDTVSAGDLHVVQVGLGTAEGAYLVPETLGDGVVATRTVEAGELVPASAVGDAAAARTTTVVIRSAVDVPTSVRPGTVVEVWAAPAEQQGRHGTPAILVADATVSSVSDDDSLMGRAAASLEIVIPRADVADVLAAVAAESALSVVPTSGAVR